MEAWLSAVEPPTAGVALEMWLDGADPPSPRSTCSSRGQPSKPRFQDVPRGRASAPVSAPPSDAERPLFGCSSRPSPVTAAMLCAAGRKLSATPRSERPGTPDVAEQRSRPAQLPEGTEGTAARQPTDAAALGALKTPSGQSGASTEASCIAVGSVLHGVGLNLPLLPLAAPHTGGMYRVDPGSINCDGVQAIPAWKGGRGLGTSDSGGSANVTFQHTHLCRWDSALLDEGLWDSAVSGTGGRGGKERVLEFGEAGETRGSDVCASNKEEAAAGPRSWLAAAMTGKVNT